MIWSRHHPDDWRDYEDNLPHRTATEQRRAYDAIRLDLTAPAEIPDGEYTAVVERLDATGSAPGIIIQDGRFAPEPTHHAILQAAAIAHGWDPDASNSASLPMDHVFIEDFRYDAANHAIIVGCGS